MLADERLCRPPTRTHRCRKTVLVAVLFGILALLVPQGRLWADGGVDKENDDIDFNGANTDDETSWYVDYFTDKVEQWNMRYYEANSAASPDLLHAYDDDGDFLAHNHWQREWGTDFVGDTPWVCEKNAYWDERFFEPVKTDRVFDAWVQHETCHEWALQLSGADGRYNYQLQTPALSHVRDNDLYIIGNHSQVNSKDILTYSRSSPNLKHSTYVDSTRSNGSGGREPKEIQWKWCGSGIYEDTTSYSYPFATPKCVTDGDLQNDEEDVTDGEDTDSQGWDDWNRDYAGEDDNLTVYRDDF